MKYNFHVHTPCRAELNSRRVVSWKFFLKALMEWRYLLNCTFEMTTQKWFKTMKISHISSCCNNNENRSNQNWLDRVCQVSLSLPCNFILHVINSKIAINFFFIYKGTTTSLHQTSHRITFFFKCNAWTLRAWMKIFHVCFSQYFIY